MSSRDFIFCPGKPCAWLKILDFSLSLETLASHLTQEQYLVWLDSAQKNKKTARFSILGWDPWLEEISNGKRNPLRDLKNILSSYSGPMHPYLPSIGLGIFCFFGYELNRWIERLPAQKPSDEKIPEMILLGMRMMVIVDHEEGRTFCIYIEHPNGASSKKRYAAFGRLEDLECMIRGLENDALNSSHVLSPDLPFSKLNPSLSQRQFEEMVLKAKSYITEGEIFQANLSQRFQIPEGLCPWQLYTTLRRINPSPFACFARLKDFSLVSCSPERLVAVRGETAFARPIAGTRPRGITQEEDITRALELITSDKERAEHIMLVDLARNDMGRFCRYGSVVVDELMSLESYSHVVHIVSNVMGRCRSSIEPDDVIRAMFPGGTITGCPKVRCMQIINELEPLPRGFYTGSAGYISFDGSLDLNILIRTIVAFPDHLSFHVGAGIVADSDPELEYHETLAKAQALVEALKSSFNKVNQNALLS
jgi:para-aminobenzoate synthetase component I